MATSLQTTGGALLMTRIQKFFILYSLLFSSALSASNAPAWQTSYEAAVQESQTSSKPIILFFTGSDWCPLCKQLEREVFNSREFIAESKDKYIYVKLDFPLDHSLSPTLTAQNKSLQRKFDVRAFPTVVILDSNQHPIGVTGYRPGGGKCYSAHLNKIISDYSRYQERLNQLDKSKLSGGELKELYLKARKMGRLSDAERIVDAGMRKSDNRFFMIEKYRILASEGHLSDDQALELKNAILSSDPRNKGLTHYQIAVIDFEAACAEMEKENFSPETTVAPLISYINKFGCDDPDHLWRLEMIISQIYLDKGKVADALKHAKDCLNSAPESSKPEIALAIQNIQAQVR